MRHLGPLGVSGAALILLAVIGYLGVILPGQSRLQQLSLQVAEEQARQKLSRPDQLADDHSSAEARLHAFYDFFPARDSAPELINKIYSAARDESINLSAGEYRFSRLKQGRMGKYQIELPVRGPYVQIKKFIARVLNSIPSAALAGLSFKRDIVSSGVVAADISFTIYLGAT